MRRILKIKMTTTRILALGFFAGILLGSFLLWLPVSSKAGETISYKISWWWRNFLNWVLKGLLCHQVPIDSKLYSKDC